MFVLNIKITKNKDVVIDKTIKGFISRATANNHGVGFVDGYFEGAGLSRDNPVWSYSVGAVEEDIFCKKCGVKLEIALSDGAPSDGTKILDYYEEGNYCRSCAELEGK